MTLIKPFKAIRAKRDKVSLVASRSYLTYTKKTLLEKLENNPYTFLHIINPDYSDSLNIKSRKEKNMLVRNKFLSFMEKGIFFEESKECLYVYQQTKGIKKYTGIIGGASLEDYNNGKIKIHEKTISSREKMFGEYLNETGFNAEPVLLAYKKNKEINKILNEIIKSRAEYEFSTTNKVTHKLWVINNKEIINKLQHEFKSVQNTYIADGHHRMASSALLFNKNNLTSNAFCLSLFIADDELDVLNFNRLIKDLNGLTNEEFLNSLEKSFFIRKKSFPFDPKKENEIGMYLNKSWYSLTYKFDINEIESIVDRLDPSIVTKKILDPILDIKNLRNNKKIDFIDGENINRAIELVDKQKYKAVFIVKKISTKDIFKVADQGLTMPPKSTYIFPKLRSGLIIYKFT